MDDYVVKPLNQETLLDVLIRHLGVELSPPIVDITDVYPVVKR
jgi:hypothetical protein